jgi:hypothetical protein
VICGVHHRGGLVEQHDLIDILDLACVEHDLLSVDDLETDALQLQPHARFNEVHPKRHVRDAGLDKQIFDLFRVTLHQSGGRGHRAAHPEHPGAKVFSR